MTRISAIMCVRNGAARLPRALASIRAQTRPPDEVIVVDGRSADTSAAIAAGWGARVVIQEGDGLADARNLGIACAEGDLLAFLDHDDRWVPDKLARQAAALERLPGPSYAVAHLRFVTDEAGPVPGPRGLPRLGRTPGTLLAHRAIMDHVGPFAGEFGMGCDMDWFARAASHPPVTDSEVLLLKTLRADALSADPGRNRAAAFAVVARRLAERRAG